MPTVVFYFSERIQTHPNLRSAGLTAVGSVEERHNGLSPGGQLEAGFGNAAKGAHPGLPPVRDKPSANRALDRASFAPLTLTSEQLEDLLRLLFADHQNRVDFTKP